MRYLWWAEFQKRGALHYHMVLVDPPFALERDARRWFDAHWRAADGGRLAGVQTWVEFRSGAWFQKKAGDYVLKDVRKLHGKRYEQDYARMPRGWRTFRSHQLAFTAAAHQKHETKAWTVCTAAADAPWHAKQREIWVERIDWHVPHPGGCRLYERRRPRARVPKRGGAMFSAKLWLPGNAAPNTGASQRGGGPPRAGLRPVTGFGQELHCDPKAGGVSLTSCRTGVPLRSLGWTAAAYLAPSGPITEASRSMAHIDVPLPG